jgi:hypothetical protein
MGWRIAVPVVAAQPALPDQAEIRLFSANHRPIFVEPALGSSARATTPPLLGAKRERILQLDPTWFVAPAPFLQLNLFPDTDYDALIDSAEVVDDVWVFHGHVDQHAESALTVAYQDGVVSGMVLAPGGGHFEIRYAGNGLHRVVEMDPNQRLPCGVGPGQSPLSDPTAVSHPNAGRKSASSGNIVDVMVLYTPAMLNYAGNMAAMNTMIAEAVGYMNEAFHRSSVTTVQIHLAYKGEISYTESGNTQTDLTWLSTDPTVAALRSNCGADLVAMMCSQFTDGFAGRAYFLSDGGTYSVSGYGGAAHFTHELGHNFGCDHDRAHAGNGGSYPYSYGYAFVPPNPPNTNGIIYGDVMTYLVSDLEQFSNPNVYFMTVPTGVPDTNPQSADNATTVINTASTVAAQAAPNFTILTSPELVGTHFKFLISGPNNGVYNVEYTSDYFVWSVLGSYTLSSGSVEVADDTIGSTPYRFYRARLGSSYMSTQVGFLKKLIKPGISMIGNPLETGNNVVSTLLPLVPEGTQLLKWVEGTQSWTANTFSFGKWESPNMTLQPGEGVVIENHSGSQFEVQFVGAVNPAFNIRVSVQYSILSSPAPQAGGLTSVLNYNPFEPGVNDQVLKMTGSDGSYTTYTWNGSSWAPSEPIFDVGEAFWAYNPVAAVQWSRVLWTWP